MGWNLTDDRLPIGTILRGPHPVSREMVEVKITQAWEDQRVLTLTSSGRDLARDSVSKIFACGFKIAEEE
jgi:hypothetical protein